jgi:hypothetical protein
MLQVFTYSLVLINQKPHLSFQEVGFVYLDLSLTLNLACRAAALAKAGTLGFCFIMAPSGFGLSYCYRAIIFNKNNLSSSRK